MADVGHFVGSPGIGQVGLDGGIAQAQDFLDLPHGFPLRQEGLDSFRLRVVEGLPGDEEFFHLVGRQGELRRGGLELLGGVVDLHRGVNHLLHLSLIHI